MCVCTGPALSVCPCVPIPTGTAHSWQEYQPADPGHTAVPQRRRWDPRHSCSDDMDRSEVWWRAGQTCRSYDTRGHQRPLQHETVSAACARTSPDLKIYLQRFEFRFSFALHTFTLVFHSFSVTPQRVGKSVSISDSEAHIHTRWCWWMFMSLWLMMVLFSETSLTWGACTLHSDSTKSLLRNPRRPD